MRPTPPPRLGIIVAQLDAHVHTAIGAHGPFIFLSPETLAKNRRRHPEIGDLDYDRIPALIQSLQLVVRDAARAVVIVSCEGRSYWMAVKATESGAAMFLTSFRITRPGDIERLLRKGEVLLDRRQDAQRGKEKGRP